MPTANTPSRRAFLRGGFNATPILRPVGALAEPSFLEACTGCGDCARACPEKILFRGDGNYPVLKSKRACTFCNACVDVCETGALSADMPWTWRAQADDTCLSRNGVQCRACQDHCEYDAIRFRLQPGGRSEPMFDADLCTGCGGCVAPCPVTSIHLLHPNPQTEAQSC